MDSALLLQIVPSLVYTKQANGFLPLCTQLKDEWKLGSINKKYCLLQNAQILLQLTASPWTT